jgi:hypothetical protein
MIDECRQRQLKELNRRREEERNESLRIQQRWTQEKLEYDEQEAGQKRIARKNATELSDFNRRQMVMNISELIIMFTH